MSNKGKESNAKKFEEPTPQVDFSNLAQQLEEAKKIINKVENFKIETLKKINDAVAPFAKQLVDFGLTVQVKIVSPRATNGNNKKYDYFLNGNPVKAVELKSLAVSKGLIEADKSYKNEFITKKLHDAGVDARMELIGEA